MTLPRFDPWEGIAPSLEISSLSRISRGTPANPKNQGGQVAATVSRISGFSRGAPPKPENPSSGTPPPGSPERDRFDRNHAETVRGLMNMAMQRPVSWADPDALPSPGCWCSCCQGRRWWCERIEPKGWRCATCHPFNPGQDVREVRT
jgi:hypothetical protein